MDIVTVKNKFQIVIPQHIRELVQIEIGDILEAAVEVGNITFTPKTFVNRHLAEGLEGARMGRMRGLLDTAHEDYARPAVVIRKAHSKQLRFLLVNLSNPSFQAKK